MTLVNVWASWCVPCADEVPFLEKLSKDKRIQLVGINYKDADRQCAALPQPLRQSVRRRRRRRQRPHLDRLGRLWRAGDLSDRPRRHHRLQAGRAGHRRKSRRARSSRKSTRRRRSTTRARAYVSTLYLMISGICSAPNTNVSGTTPNSLKLTQKSVVCVRQTISLARPARRRTAPSARSACASLRRSDGTSDRTGC